MFWRTFLLLAGSVSLFACGAKVVFEDDGGGARGGDGAGGRPTERCEGEVCTEGNQCCCGRCQTLDLPCEEPCVEECPEPYHGWNPNGNCVWSCGEGTQPDDVSNECVCQPGLVEVGLDQFGRRICAAPKF